MSRGSSASWAVLGIFAVLSWGRAAEVEVVLEGLDNPCGVAVQPGTGDVFVSESGAGRVLRLVQGKGEEVITGFGRDTYGDGPRYAIGPLGLLFLGRDGLVVGGGDLPAGEELLRVFQVPNGGQPLLKAESAVTSLSLPASEGVPGEGDFYGLAASRDAVYVTCHGDDTKGWLARAPLRGGKLTGLDRFIATKPVSGVGAPVAVTVSPRGELVVGQMGESSVPRDSRLVFYHANTGRPLLNLPSGLFDITALAYGPDGQLYATDFAWMQSDQGGLFQLAARLADGKQVVQARRVLSLDKPTALAFADGGALYVTIFGAAPQDGETKSGKLLKIKL